MNPTPQTAATVSPRFVVGIDLGTTNSAVAFVDTAESETPFAIRIFRIPQLTGAGEVEARETLPSFHYEPAPREFDDESLRLPWGMAKSGFVGVFARDRGADAPGRLIASAKSWLSHSGVDRTADLLPWHGAPDVTKLSPTDASARFLTHIRTAWNHAHAAHPLEDQDVVITIPASFDEVARQLTVTAARRAGLPRVVLLEEPQAAFYAWMKEHAQSLIPGQTILVCDVGGGTSDFTLIQAQPARDGWLRFHRFAVGDHLILGGDNLDLALAHFVEARLGENLQPRQWSVLVQRCRHAKETLLAAGAPDSVTISIPAPGSRLVAAARQATLTRDEVATLLVDGFLPRVALADKPAKRSSGFQEFGLPYAPDPAITRYLAAFLSAGAAPATRPGVVLFNGGLFESPIMRDRLLEVLASWFPEDAWQPQVLTNNRLDLAVAIGAANYGMVRRGAGIKISGGLAHSYYIGIEKDSAPAAVCLAPAGLEEGEGIDLPGREFELLVKRPAEFPLYVSSARTGDKPGDILPVEEGQLTALPPIRTALRAAALEEATVRVRLHAKLTEIGVLEVWCAEPNDGRRWKLQFDVRSTTQSGGDSSSPASTAALVDEQTASRCGELIRAVFSANGAAPPDSLVKQLENSSALNRHDWPPSLLRYFWEELIDADGRTRGPTHEARWLNLLGFSLRPGYGFPVDDWRAARTWQLSSGGVIHKRNELCRAEWWILWRRIAGGLTAGQQRTLADPLVAAIRKASSHKPGRHTSNPLDGSHEASEIWRLLGSLECLNPPVKIELAETLLDSIESGNASAWLRAALWTLGRLTARVPVYGPLNALVPTDYAETSVTRLLRVAQSSEIPEAASETLCFALMQMGRCTGDRYRDIAENTRQTLLRWMAISNAPSHYAELVRTPGAKLREEEQDSVFGETLPHGLRLMA